MHEFWTADTLKAASGLKFSALLACRRSSAMGSEPTEVGSAPRVKQAFRHGPSRSSAPVVPPAASVVPPFASELAPGPGAASGAAAVREPKSHGSGVWTSGKTSFMNTYLGGLVGPRTNGLVSLV